MKEAPPSGVHVPVPIFDSRDDGARYRYVVLQR